MRFPKNFEVLLSRKCVLACCIALSAAMPLCAQDAAKKNIDLPTSKLLQLPVPGSPQRVNSLPMSLAVSPDKRWVVSLNAGYGTLESEYDQSLAVLDTQTGRVRDFPDNRTLVHYKQTFYSGLAFSADGKRLYATLASLTDPEAKMKGDTGSGIAVYSFVNGVLTPQRFIKLPLVTLAAGHRTLLRMADNGSLGVPFAAAIAVLPGAPERLLIAENLSDTVAIVNGETGAVEHRFDLSSNEIVPSVYPIALAVTKDGARAFVALWNASEVVELDLAHTAVTRRIALLKPKLPTAAGTHPCALLLDERTATLYVALANRDAVGAVDIGKPGAAALAVRGYFDTRLPGQSYFGAQPNALAENADGTRLYVANMGTDSIAVLDPRKLKSMAKAKGMAEPIGFVPTEWLPSALDFADGRLFIATGKGQGIGPNDKPQKVTPETNKVARFNRGFTYDFTLLYGSLATVDEHAIERDLKESTAQVLASNRMRAAGEKIDFANGHNPIKHVIYIIKENRTYDQVFGDLSIAGKRVGNGDPALTMYGAAITPNEHKLALQFGVLDNFFDSGEVSGDGHVWSTAGIGTDYLEKTIQQSYRGEQRNYDYEGIVAAGYPLLQHIPDVVEAPSGYLWTNLAAHGKTLYHFGEYVASTFCAEKKAKMTMDPQQGAWSGETAECPAATIKPGEAIPEEWGGGVNLWPWPIPRLAKNTATKPELVGHFAPEAPDFNLLVPDQIRVAIFMRHLAQWESDRKAGHDTMPNFVMLRLGNDHTAGTKAGSPTPKASIADNDLAVGRAVEAISHSAYWDDTAFFILEDDAQNGGDHVDAHRSLGIVVSKYAPHPKAGDAAFVDSRFYTTVSVLRTMETLLGLPPMNNNDAFASMISSLFTGPGDQPAYSADTSNRDNGLIYTANKPAAPGAAASAKMDFSHADRADSSKLNVILWQDAMGDKPMPSMLLVKHPKVKDDDDD
jgi:DNA-binding beta-propeller fold protein YncE